MEQAILHKIHAMLTTHVNYKEVKELKDKNRYYFQRFDETATVQIPKNENARFVYTYLDEETKEMPFWLQHIVKECEKDLSKIKEKTTVGAVGVTEKQNAVSKQQAVTVPHPFIKEEDWLDLPIVLKGTLETEQQLLWVKQLIQSGFEVFPDED